MQNLPFRLPGRWYRGNLHTHSTISDGDKTPAEVCTLYRERGYDFIGLTDLFTERYQFPITDTVPFRTDGFTTILGAELHAPATSLGDQWHILAVGLPADFAPTGSAETGPQLAERAREAGAYVAAAHPAWYDLTDQDLLSIASCWGHRNLQYQLCRKHRQRGQYRLCRSSAQPRSLLPDYRHRRRTLPPDKPRLVLQLGDGAEHQPGSRGPARGTARGALLPKPRSGVP